MKNQFSQVEKHLRAMAKRYRSIRFSTGLTVLFLMLGINAFAEEAVTQAKTMTRPEIGQSLESMIESFERLRTENNKLLSGAKLELIQLMEQGDQVVKSPWSSWQFGLNYMHNNWSKTYKGKGDKAKKYPYEGVFTRSANLFLRNISPLSEKYNKYTASTLSTRSTLSLGSRNFFATPSIYSHSSGNSSLLKEEQRKDYGLETGDIRQEPIVKIELGAAVKPKNIEKHPIEVNVAKGEISPVEPIKTPEPPKAPDVPDIPIEKFDPVKPEPISITLPEPPVFNIKLGSYRNYMEQNTLGQVDGGRFRGNGKSYNSSNSSTVNSGDLGEPTVVYAWADPSPALDNASGFNSALLKVYFDYTNRGGNGGGTLTVNTDLTIDSIRGDIVDTDVNARPWNNQDFLVGGSRVATLDNAVGGASIINKGTINLVGPLVVGYEIQNDEVKREEHGHLVKPKLGKREIINEGTITDKKEETMEKIGNLAKGDTIKLGLAPKLGGESWVKNLDDWNNYLQDNGITLKRTDKGYLGYKVGMILTHEFDDPNPEENFYRLENAEGGTIEFQGGNSIGIQVYAPPKEKENTRIEVLNQGTITLGGEASYGLKLSSRIMEKTQSGKKSKFENKGTINITGDGGMESGSQKFSLSSGMAVIQDKDYDRDRDRNGIRAYKGLVNNSGTINVSGGSGNTGMILVIRKDDDITNGKQIKVSGQQNIGMRVDFGGVILEPMSLNPMSMAMNVAQQDDIITPEAINKGDITIDGGKENIGMLANENSSHESDGGDEDHYEMSMLNVMAAEDENPNRAVATNHKNIYFKNNAKDARGMVAMAGGFIENKEGANIKGEASANLYGTVGMAVNSHISSGNNSGNIDIEGERVTGVYNIGNFEMNGKNAVIRTAGEKSISLYSAKDGYDGISRTHIKGGKIIAEKGSLGLFADESKMTLGDDNGKEVNLIAKDKGTLLFYNYTGDEAKGKFEVQGKVTGSVENGATAFYFKETLAGTGSAVGGKKTTEQQLNSMFTGSTKKLTLKLDDDSTLFVLDNAAPTDTYVNLSKADAKNINNYLGSHVQIDSTSKNYKAYKAAKSALSIDTDVDLNKTDKVAGIDTYYRVDFINSKVRLEEGKKITGGEAAKKDVIIAQANFKTGTNRDDILVENKGTIDFSKRKGTAIAVDFGHAINRGTIRMAANNGNGENSTALFGASNSLLENFGTIELGSNGVGLWGVNSLAKSDFSNKNITIQNEGKIIGVSGKKGLLGIYAANDNNNGVSKEDSKVTHSGEIDFSNTENSIGILMNKGSLLSTGNISVKGGSVGIVAEDSDIQVSSGNYNLGKEAIAFQIGKDSSLQATGGNINITGEKSVAYLLKDTTLESGSKFQDNLGVNSQNAYTYMALDHSKLKYKNTKSIDSEGAMFINANNNSEVMLQAGNDISSGKKKVIGVYANAGSKVNNAGKLSLTGEESSALYGEGNATTIVNEISGDITVGKKGSGIYVVGNTGENKGSITLGEQAIGMVAGIVIKDKDGNIVLEGTGKISNTGKILSTADSAIGMSQQFVKTAGEELVNEGEISLTGERSVGMHSENEKNLSFKMINKGEITVGDSSDHKKPSVGMYADSNKKSITNTTIVNEKKVKVGNSSIGVYGGNIELKANSETITGAGGVGLYSKLGQVNIDEGAKISVGESLGEEKEGVAVFLAGNNQTLTSKTSSLDIGKGSFAYVVTGENNQVTTGKSGGTNPAIDLKGDSVFLYSTDTKGTVTNYNHIKSSGNKNYGIYSSGKVENHGDIDFSAGVGNVGMYSSMEGITTPAPMINYGNIKVSASDIDHLDSENNSAPLYGIGMAAGYTHTEEDKKNLNSSDPDIRKKVPKQTIGNIENYGTIEVTTADSIGMYATGKGSKAINHENGIIKLSGNKRNIGMFIDEEAEGINKGEIVTVGTGNKGQIGVYVGRGAKLHNYGKIKINAEGGYGVVLGGGTIANYDTFEIEAPTKVRKVEKSELGKVIGDEGIDHLRFKVAPGQREADIFLNGENQKKRIEKPSVEAIANRKPTDIPLSSVGMYLDTVNPTKPIMNLGALHYLKEADLIIGTEITKYTNSKYIQVDDKIIKPYNDAIIAGGVEKWSIYSGSLTWMATITQKNDNTILNAYLAKIPYTVFAGDKKENGIPLTSQMDWNNDMECLL